MKAAAIFAAAICVLSLSACEHFDQDAGVTNLGNPSNMPYAGEKGSVYDRTANPPTDIGRASYNPYQPLENVMPAGQALPPPVSPVTAAPLAPLPGTARPVR